MYSILYSTPSVLVGLVLVLGSIEPYNLTRLKEVKEVVGLAIGNLLVATSKALRTYSNRVSSSKGNSSIGSKKGNNSSIGSKEGNNSSIGSKEGNNSSVGSKSSIGRLLILEFSLYLVE
ncbi:hypothetical protein BKA81DRAFT_381025 [Phyllosticta paracitricarpa]